MKNIIIFGGAGFIGTNLTKRLLDEGNKVLCVDNYFTGRLVNINQFLKNQNYLCWNADITNKETFEKIDDIIVDYAITTKMSSEEILDCLFEMGADDKDSIFYDTYNSIKMNL